MKHPRTRRAVIPGHFIALSALAALAALFAYALYERAAVGRPVAPEASRPADISRVDMESWAKSAQQKVLGMGPNRFSAGAEAPTVVQDTDFTVAERPIRRTVTHVGVAPHRAHTPRWRPANGAPSYGGPSLANLPPPGD